MSLVKAELSSLYFTVIRTEPGTLVLPLLAPDTIAVVDPVGAPSASAHRVVDHLNTLARHTSRKRKRVCTFPGPPMGTRRSGDGASYTTPHRHSGRPQSAKEASRSLQQEQCQQLDPLPSGLHVRRARRPHSAIRTEYLGVSAVAFAPPLRRYLKSPQHGRHALRSSKSSSARHLSGTATAGVESARCPSARTKKPRGRHVIGASDPDSLSYSTAPGDSHEGSVLDASHAGGSESGVATPHRVEEPPTRDHPRHFLAPVGPDWWDSECSQAGSGAGQDSPETTDAPSGQIHSAADGCGLDDGIAGLETPSRTGESPSRTNRNHVGSNDILVGLDDFSSSRSSDQQGGSGSGSDLHRDHLFSSRGGGSALPASRGRRRTKRREAPRNYGWDLLTGRRVERGHRKGSHDIRIPGEPSRLTEDQWMSHADTRVLEVLSKPAQVVWRKSRTIPLEYPTPAVRRGITRFHEQVQRARLIDGKRPLENLPDVKEPMTGVRPATTVQRRPPESMPLPVRWEEERDMIPGDVLVTVQHCTACARHRMSLHHNPDTYMQRAAAVQDAVRRALADAGRHSSASGRVAGQTASRQSSQSTLVVTKATTERSSSGGIGRVGAFEVQVTANLLAEQAQKGGLIAPLRLRTHDQTAPNTCTGLMRSLTVSSKLSSGKWPNPDGVARKVVETLNGWGALQQPQQNSGSGSRDTCSGETNGNGRDEGSAGAEDCPTVTAHAAPVVATGKRCPVDGVLNGLRGNEFSSTKASIASPSQSAKLGRGSGETLFDSTLTDPYPGGGQPVGAGMSHDGLVGGVVVDRGAATPSASSAYVARSQGDEARNVAVELATVTEGEVAVTPGTAPFLFSLSVESAFAEGVEFAAEGSTADPCFLLKVGSHDSERSDPVADVPGGSGGQCRWPSRVCSVWGLREADLRSLGVEVEIWDDLGWIIAKGKVASEDVGQALDAELYSLRRAASSTPYDSAAHTTLPTLTCALRCERGPSNSSNGRVTLQVRLSPFDRGQSKPGHGATAKNPALQDSKKRDDESASLGNPAAARGKVAHRTGLDAFRAKGATGMGRPQSSSSPVGEGALQDKAGHVIEEVNDLLALSTRIHGHGSFASSVGSEGSSAGAGSGSGRDSSGADDLSDALGGVLIRSRATTADDPMEESWSSVESAGLGSGPSVTLAQKLAAPHATNAIAASATPTSNGQPENPSPAGLEISPAIGGGPTGVAAGVERDAKNPPVAVPRAVEKAEGVRADEGAVSTTAAEVLAAAPGAAAVVPAASGSSATYSTSERSDGDGYDDENFDYDDDENGEHQDLAQTPCSQEIFSFSSASTTSSSSGISGPDADPRQGGGDGEVEETGRVLQHERAEVTVAAAAATLRRRLLRAAEQFCGGSGGADIKKGVTRLFDRLDEDQDGQLTAEDLKNALSVNGHNMGLGHKREAALSPATVIAALVAGMDRVGKRSANAPEFESFILDCPNGSPPNTAATAGPEKRTSATPQTHVGVEMATLWLRLRRAALIKGKEHWTHVSGNHPALSASIASAGASEAYGKVKEGGKDGDGRTWVESELDGGWNLSRLGMASFEKSDPEGSGSVSQAVFREVVSGSEVQIQPSLTEREISALSRHFGSSCSDTARRHIRGIAKGIGARCSPDLGSMVSYRALMAWVDPVDVGRIAKRVSRFLRAVGDPSSKFGALVSSGGIAGQEEREQNPATVAAAAATVSRVPATGHIFATETSSTEALSDPSSAMDPPAGIQAKSLQRREGVDGANDAPEGTPAIATAAAAAGTAATDNGGRGDDGDHERTGVAGTDRRAITELFRAVDTDGSGLISPEELHEAVNGLGLPVSAAEARLLVAEYGGTLRGGQGEREVGGENQLSLGDFDSMLRPQPLVSRDGVTALRRKELP